MLKSLFKETGKLGFANVTADLGLDNRELPGADDRPWIWDFDGDGWLDIAGFSDESPAVSAWNVGGKKLVSTGNPLFSPLSHPREILDLNGDGYLDLDGGAKGQWFYEPKSRTFRHDANPRFEPPAGVPSGLADALAVHKKANRFFSLDYWTHALHGYDTLGYDPRPIDLNGDGRSDVVVHGSGGYGAVYLGRYLLREADSKLSDRTKELGLPEAGAPILVDDLTGDGRPEILIAGEKDSGLYVNDDGRMDLAIGGSANSATPAKEITIYLNSTKGAGNHIRVEPRMPAPNPFAVGAVVEVGDHDRVVIPAAAEGKDLGEVAFAAILVDDRETKPRIGEDKVRATTCQNKSRCRSESRDRGVRAQQPARRIPAPRQCSVHTFSCRRPPRTPKAGSFSDPV